MIVLFSALGLFATTVAEQASPAPAVAKPVAVKGAKEPKQHMICVNDPGTGSIIPKKICHTQSDWDALNGDGVSAANELRRQQEIIQANQR